MIEANVVKMMKLVDLALGKPKFTYMAQENQPKPKGSFAAVQLISEENPGIDTTVTVQVDADEYAEITRGIRILTFEVYFSEAGDMASRLMASFRRPDIYEYMMREQFAVMDMARARNTTTTLDTNWEMRDCVRVTCSAPVEYVYQIGIVEKVEAPGVYYSGEDATDILIQVP